MATKSKIKSTILSAIRNCDYVKAISQVDLLGNCLDAFTIRIALSAMQGSIVRLLLEAQLMEKFSSLLAADANGQGADGRLQEIGVIVEVMIYCNVFLHTEISCERLIQKIISVQNYYDTKVHTKPQRPTAVKFASSVAGGSSSSSSNNAEHTVRGECTWTIFATLLDLYGHKRPFLRRLLEYMLVNLRAYVQDYSQYQQFADQLMTILRALRSAPDRKDHCTCSENIIPLFLAACISEYKNQNSDYSDQPESSSSSVSASSYASELFNAEQVQEFWSSFKIDPIGLYSVFVGRLRFLADSLSGDRTPRDISCFCPCHSEEWRRDLMATVVRDQRPPAVTPDIVQLLYYPISRMSQVLSASPSAEKPSLGLSIEDILDYMALSNDNVSKSVPTSPLSLAQPLRTTDETPRISASQFDPLDSDESTTIWSADSVRLPLQPETDELLQATRRVHDDTDSSSPEAEVFDRNELQERKARFNEEVLALQRRFLHSSSSSHTVTNTDSDVESLPLDVAPDFPTHKTLTGLSATVQEIVTVPKKPKRGAGIDRATSPHEEPLPTPFLKTEMASQTSLRFGHAAIQTDGVVLKDAIVLAETQVTQTEAQTDPSVAPNLGSLVSQKQDSFLHVQDMTNRDVQRIFRSAQAFANIC